MRLLKTNEPMVTMQVRLTKQQLKRVDLLVRRGLYNSRSEAIRGIVRAMMHDQEKKA